MKRLSRRPWILAALLAALVLGCASTRSTPPLGFSEEALPIDLERFMGDWFVVAHIPTAPEAEAHNAVESYSLRDDRRIDVRFRFCEGAPEGPARELAMTAWVHNPETNAEWRVRPRWPLRFRYQILELDPLYTRTVIGHPSGRWAWIMARDATLPESEITAITERLAAQGYATKGMRIVPQSGGGCDENA